jgi:hypothetical protein
MHPREDLFIEPHLRRAGLLRVEVERWRKSWEPPPVAVFMRHSPVGQPRHRRTPLSTEPLRAGGPHW